MGVTDNEEQYYQDEVKQIKQWWTDSRWRFTKRAYTAEQIASKRGNLAIEYPSNAMAKKLWKTIEGRFAVRRSPKIEHVRMVKADTIHRTRPPAPPTAVSTRS